MKLYVFSCPEGFLLSSESMLTSKMAQAHWPLSLLLGTIDCDDLPKEMFSRVADEIDAKDFSLVAAVEALRVDLVTMIDQTPNRPLLHPHQPE